MAATDSGKRALEKAIAEGSTKNLSKNELYELQEYHHKATGAEANKLRDQYSRRVGK
ncbi:MAG: hypothetical protein LBE03_01505 [Candidatus Nomurabacteria bacterium]|jgi:hypothetical protein|nr:hypothetical protein [Candidatus Nomurabacteria bacterium]